MMLQKGSYLVRELSLSIMKFIFVGLCFSGGLLADKAWAESEGGSTLLVTSEGSSETDVYDPFADYGEFDVSSGEEADLNFFRNGRLFTAGVVLGAQGFTDTMSELYNISPAYGFYISYFFDLRFALQLTLLFSSNDFAFEAFQKTISGNSFVSAYGLNLKYFINTQNITRGLAQFNPYLTLGFSQTLLSTKIDSKSTVTNDPPALGAELGLGIEIPIRNGLSYIGFQGTYKLVTFQESEGVEIVIEQGPTGIVPRGDLWNMVAIFGFNF